MQKIILIVLFILCLTGCKNICSEELLESVSSPNGKYTIKTYLNNCGATTDWLVRAELCNEKDECKEIYNCYHENASSVKWIDNENISINNKNLNVFKDKYDWHDDKDYYDKLYKK